MKKGLFAFVLVISMLLTACNQASTRKAVTSFGSSDTLNQNSKGDSTVNLAYKVYKKILSDEAEFYSVDDKKKVKLSQFEWGVNQPLKTVRFSVLNMDSDSVPEIVLESENHTAYEILHFLRGSVYGYSVINHGLDSLKLDGTFYFANGTEYGSYWKPKFLSSSMGMITLGESGLIYDNPTKTEIYYVDNHEVDKAVYKAFQTRQDSKPDVVWFDFSVENINSKLS